MCIFLCIFPHVNKIPTQWLCQQPEHPKYAAVYLFTDQRCPAGCFEKCEGKILRSYLTRQPTFSSCYQNSGFLGHLTSWIWCPGFSSWLLLLVSTLYFSCPRPKSRCKMIPDSRFFLTLLFLHWLCLCQILFYTVQRTVAFVGARHSCSLVGSTLINPLKKVPRFQTDTKYRKELRRQREAFRKWLGVKEFLLFLSAGVLSLYCLYAIAFF